MKIKCLDVCNGISRSGKPYSTAAFRGIGKSGNPFLFVASCPPDYKAGADYDAKVAFTQSGNFILPY